MNYAYSITMQKFTINSLLQVSGMYMIWGFLNLSATLQKLTEPSLLMIFNPFWHFNIYILCFIIKATWVCFISDMVVFIDRVAN
jgi:hypothetical protein